MAAIYQSRNRTSIAARMLGDARKKIVIKVRVEGKDDESFWYNILKKYSPSHFDYEIIYYEKGSSPQGKLRLASGKKEILKKHGSNVNCREIICVDSDYDYLLSDSCEIARIMQRNRKYIFQTYTYSIENYFCYAESLGPLCNRAGNTEPNPSLNQSFLKFFSLLSYILYPLFILSLYFENRRREWREKNRINDNTFTITEFCKTIDLYNLIKRFKQKKSLEIQSFYPAKFLLTLRDKVRNKAKTLLTQVKPNELTKIEQLLTTVQTNGVAINRNNVYLFINGKIIFLYLSSIFPKIVVSKVNEELQKINQLQQKGYDTDDLRKQLNRRLLLKDLGLEIQQGQKTLTQEQAKIVEIRAKTLLQENIHNSCETMQKLIEDIKRFVNEFAELDQDRVKQTTRSRKSWSGINVVNVQR